MNKNIKILFLISGLTYFIQGFEGLPSQAMFVWMKNVLKLSPSAIMYLGMFIGLAWTIKPLLGYLIDRFFGKKTWYLGAILGSVALCTGVSIFMPNLTILVVIMTLLSAFASIRDISNDGMMVVEGKKNNICGKLQAIQWVSITFAGLIVGIAGGWIAQNVSYQTGFKFLIPVYILAGVLLYKFKDKKESKEKREFPKLSELVLLLKNRQIIWACLFIFFYKYSPSFGTPLSFIIRDNFHWNEMFIGYLGAITSVLSIIGAILYFIFGKNLNIRKWIFWAVIINGATTFLYLYFTPKTAILYDCVFSLSGMFIHLIIMDFMARNSVEGLETTSFALLCSINNVAGSASSATGAFLYPILGLNTLIVVSGLTSFISLLFINKIFKNT